MCCSWDTACPHQRLSDRPGGCGRAAGAGCASRRCSWLFPGPVGTEPESHCHISTVCRQERHKQKDSRDSICHFKADGKMRTCHASTESSHPHLPELTSIASTRQTELPSAHILQDSPNPFSWLERRHLQTHSLKSLAPLNTAIHTGIMRQDLTATYI